MPINSVDFPILSPQQAAPFLTGMSTTQDILTQQIMGQLARANTQAQLIKNQYLPQQQQQSVLAQQLANQITQQQVPFAGKMAAAQLSTEQAKPAYMRAEGQELTQGRIPYEQSEAAKNQVFVKNPLLSTTGVGQDIGSLVYAMKNYPQLFGNGVQSNTPFNQGNQSVSPDLLNAAQGGGTPGDASQNSNPMGNIGGLLTGAVQGQLMSKNPLQMAHVLALQKQLQEQASTDVSQYQSAQNDASQTSNDALDMRNYIDQFLTHYQNTNEKGFGVGRLPAVGSEAQLTDAAGRNMQALILKLMKTNRMTNYELQFSGGLKLNRAMNPEAVQEMSDFLYAKSDRLAEAPEFLSAAQQAGISPQIAKALFQQYNNQRPVYDFQNQNTPSWAGSWRDYLTPQAVNSIKTGGAYVPVPNFKNKQEAKFWYSHLSNAQRQNVRQQTSQGE